MQAETVDRIFETLSANNKEPKTELKYINNFTLLVAVVLSAQATDVSVNKATKSLFATYNTPEAILELGEEKLKDYIKSIGLYSTKARNIIALCYDLIKYHNSDVPRTFEELIKLPGVGRKTANVILNCLFDEPTIAVDTHVYRVARRLGLAKGNSPEKVELELLKAINIKWLKHAHHWLILHGRYVCKARKPDCHNCCISQYCEYYKEIIND